MVLRIARELGMDDGVLRALAAMYRQLRRAFRLAGALGAGWQATNGILQGCPLSVILIDLLTTASKMEIDTMRRHVVVTTAALPPLLKQDQGSRYPRCACRRRAWGTRTYAPWGVRTTPRPSRSSPGPERKGSPTRKQSWTARPSGQRTPDRTPTPRSPAHGG